MNNKIETSAKEDSDTSTLTPKLRFPEFRDAEGWEAKLLEQVVNSFRTGKLDANAMVENGPYRFYTCAKNYYQIDNFAFEGEALLVAGNGVHLGYIHHYIGRFNAYQRTYVLQEFAANVVFVRCLLERYLPARILLEKKDGNTPYIVLSTLTKMPLLIPKDEMEQQRIADCLTSVDALIAAQASQVAALKAHKKGLMQQLFPRSERAENGQTIPAETTPRLRFPEFQNAGDWEETTMGRVASFASGGTPSKDNPEYWNGTIPWVSASSMYDLVIEKADHYVTPLAIGNGTRIAKKGSILILVRGSMLFKRVPICVAGLDVAFNQDVKALDLSSSINTGFLLYQISAFQSRIPINETGIGAGKIELDHLKGFEIFLPEKLEQQRVADCLTSLDDLITAHTQKLVALKTHKKGLMQQLFPVVEASEA